MSGVLIELWLIKSEIRPFLPLSRHSCRVYGPVAINSHLRNVALDLSRSSVASMTPYSGIKHDYRRLLG